MYRREGSQVSRVRVRKIANPKTDAQCEQRAFMSAVVKFYQPLANVLDRSWQGLSRSKSYAKFLKTNVTLVREAGYYLPKDSGFFPLPLQLSSGTLIGVNYTFDEENGVGWIPMTHTATGSTTIGNLSTDLVGAGLKNGDIVTIIVALKNTYANKYYPISLQFEVDTTSTALIESINSNGVMVVFDDERNAWQIATDGTLMTGLSLIVARNVDGTWLRTDAILKVNSDLLATIQTTAAKAAAIASYQGAAASENPLVYLDGDELDNA